MVVGGSPVSQGGTARRAAAPALRLGRRVVGTEPRNCTRRGRDFRATARAHARARGDEVIWKIRRNVDLTTCDQVPEPQAVCVQELTLEPEIPRDDAVQGIARPGRSIEAKWTRIWCVRPVSSETSRSACSPWSPRLRSGHRLAGLVGVERTPRRIAARAADRRVDPARARARVCANQRQVPALDLTTTNRLPARRTRARIALRRGVRTHRGRDGGRCPAAPDRRRKPRADELRGEGAVRLPAPGCTVSPAGLSTTTRCSSSRSTRTVTGCA